MIEQAPKTGFSKEQKTGFVLLLVFGILAIGLGVLQLRNTIYNPFAIKLSQGENQLPALDEQTRLQGLDTDRDGLNDWEELNFYQTSAYLPDTDSDNIVDKKEIEQGTDPLCPEGEVCKQSEEMSVSTTTVPITSPINEVGLTPEDILTKAGLVGGSGSATDFMSLLADPKKLREMLLNTGIISKEQLEKIDDQTLLQMVQELLTEQAGVGTEQ